MNRNWWLLGFAFLLSLGQLQRFQITPSIALYAHDVVVGFWVVILLMVETTLRAAVSTTIANLFDIATKNQVARLLLVVIVVGWSGSILTGHVGLRDLLYGVRICTYLLWAAVIIHDTQIHKKNLQLSALTAGMLILAFGLLQYFLLPDTRFLALSGWDDHYYRLISTLFDPNFTGLILVITFFSMWQQRTRFSNQKLVYTFLALLLLGLGLTYSRASYSALAIGLVVYMIQSPQLKLKKAILIFTVLVSIVGTGLLFSPKQGEGVDLLRTASISARTQSAQQDLASLSDFELLFGRGLLITQKNSDITPSKRADHAQFSSSLPIFIFSQLGLIGTLLLVILTFQLSRNQFTLDVSRVPTTTAIIAATLWHSLFNNSLLQPIILPILLLHMAEILKKKTKAA